MYYYSISYRTSPSTFPSAIPPEIQKEIGDDYKSTFLFGHQNKLKGDEFQFALESYLHDNKVYYNELAIIETKEITEKEYIDSTQYT
jgi:hypothetical protein